MKKIFLLAALGLLTTLVACNKSGSTDPNAGLPGYGVYGFNQNQFIGGTAGYYAQTANFPSVLQNIGSTMTLQGGFQSVLQYAMGVCNRESNVGGQASCSTWMSGASDLIIETNPQNPMQVQMTIRTYPQQNPYGNYSYTLPNFNQFFAGMFGFNTSNPQGQFNPLVLNMTLSPAFNSQGFEMRGYGPQGSRASNLLFQFQVQNGQFDANPSDLQAPPLPFLLYMNSVQAANGTVVRCQQQNCGLTLTGGTPPGAVSYGGFNGGF